MTGSRRILCLITAFLLSLPAVLANAQAYTNIVVFGDSLSDTGNDYYLSNAKYGAALAVPGPGPGINDTVGRFTDGPDTIPAAQLYQGVWIEQLAATFGSKPVIKNSRNGGTNYAYGFATTNTGTSTFKYGPQGSLSFDVENVGQQIADYLATRPNVNSQTLFVVWAGANDILAAVTPADIAAAAARDVADIQQLIGAGATDIMVPNLPPLGLIPRFTGNATAIAAATKASQDYNAALATGLVSLASANPTVNLHLFTLDVYTLFTNTVKTPPAPLKNVTAMSQGVATVNPDTYLFWDDLHPTTEGHHLIALAAQALISTGTTTTTLVTDSGTIYGATLGGAVTFTATVSTITVNGVSVSPTGTVTFFDGATPIGTAPLIGNAGVNTAKATLSKYTALSAGPHTITATFSGASGLAISTSLPLIQNVYTTGITVTPTLSAISLKSGEAVYPIFTVVPVGGFLGTVEIACGGLPPRFGCVGTTITFVTPPTGLPLAQLPSIQITTSSQQARMLNGPRPGSSHTLELATACGLLPIFGFAGLAAFRRRRPLRKLGLTLLLLVASSGAILGISGCDTGTFSVPPGTYTIPVLFIPSNGVGETVINLPVTILPQNTIN